MSELSEKLQEIKRQKDTYIIPNNLRKDITANSQSFKFSQGSRKNIILNETALKYPEPGKYDIDFKLICSTTPSWTFPHEVRFPYMKSKNPNKKIDK